MTYSWLKLYVEILDDPKVGMMPDWLFRRFIQFLLVAREHNQNGLLGPVSEMAWRLRSSDDDMLSALRTMSEIGIVAETPDGWLVVHFEARQKAIGPTERVRAFRKRERNEDETERSKTGNEDDEISSSSVSSSVSDSDLPGEGGVEGEPSEAERARLRVFVEHFGKFHGQAETERWLTLADAVGDAQAQKLIAWAEKRQVHLTNRPALLDSLETAARNWRKRDEPGKAPDRKKYVTGEYADAVNH
jgi:hypothetical protein